MKQWEYIKSRLSGISKTSIALIIGIAGIILIGASVMFDNKSKQEDVSKEKLQSDSEYCELLESKLKNLVSAITGDNECIVAITLESSNEYIYADQTKTDNDQTKDEAQNGITTKESQKNEQEYIIVKNKDGSEQALVITEKKPGIRGVAVVSSGLDNEKTEQIQNTVTAMLGITARKISITSRY